MAEPTKQDIQNILSAALGGKALPTKVKQIDTPGEIPTTANLQRTELSVDPTNGLMWYRDKSDNIVLVGNNNTGSSAESIASVQITQAEAGTFKPLTSGGYQWSHSDNDTNSHFVAAFPIKLYCVAFHTKNSLEGLELTFEVWNDTGMVGNSVWDVPDHPVPNNNGDTTETYTLPVPLDIPKDHILKIRTSAASVGGSGQLTMFCFAEDPPLATVPTSYWAGNPGTTYSVDRANGVLQAIQMTSDIEITDFTNFLNVGDEVVLHIRQDATAGYTLTVPGFASSGENVYMDESLSGGRSVQLSSYSNSRHKVVITKWHNEYDVVVSGASAFTL